MPDAPLGTSFRVDVAFPPGAITGDLCGRFFALIGDLMGRGPTRLEFSATFEVEGDGGDDEEPGFDPARGPLPGSATPPAVE